MAQENPLRKATLLNLPKNVRYQIYDYLGLRRECPIILCNRSHPDKYRNGLLSRSGCKSQNRLAPEHPNWRPVTLFDRADCRCPPVMVEIFRLCRIVATESTAYFYASNRFIFRGTCVCDFVVLLRIAPSAWRSMSSITVDLWELELLIRDRPRSLNIDDCHYGVVSPRCSRQPSKTIWTNICKTLLQKLEPHRVHLTVNFPNQSSDVIKELCLSMESMSCLKNCTITQRTSNYPHPLDLEDLVCSTIDRLTRDPMSTEEFPQFANLPIELRLEILRYTQLGPAVGGLDPSHHAIQVVNGKLQQYPVVAACWPSYRCCKVCYSDPNFCCCRHLRKSYSTTCVCRVLPIALFLVSKQMQHEARLVMFNENRLTLQGMFQDSRAFLKSLRPSELWSIRDLEIVFPEPRFCFEQVHQPWRDMVQTIKENCNVANLCLTVSVIASQEYIVYARYQQEEGKRRLHEMLCQMGIALRPLRGLKDLHLYFPLYTTLEGLLEQGVMGPEYDSYKGNRQSKTGKWEYGSDLPEWHAQQWLVVTRKVMGETEIHRTLD